MRTDVNAGDCTRGCTDTVRESALKGDWKRNPLPHRGIEPASATCRSDALSTELHPHEAAASADAAADNEMMMTMIMIVMTIMVLTRRGGRFFTQAYINQRFWLDPGPAFYFSLLIWPRSGMNVLSVVLGQKEKKWNMRASGSAGKRPLGSWQLNEIKEAAQVALASPIPRSH